MMERRTDAIQAEERPDGVAVLRLNRPERLNALTFEMIDIACAVLKRWEREPAIRCVILRGNGRAFCAGDDLKGMSDGSSEWDNLEFTLRREAGYERLFRVLYDLRKPVVAGLHGHVLGAGAVIALACDIRIAADDANIGFVFVKRGITGGTTVVPRYIGLGKATELLLTGDTLSGREAAAIGLVNYAVPATQLDEAVDHWARKLASGPTRVLGYVKYALHRGLYQDLETALALNGYAAHLSRDTEDARIGREAFRNRTEPIFVGR